MCVSWSTSYLTKNLKSDTKRPSLFLRGVDGAFRAQLEDLRPKMTLLYGKKKALRNEELIRTTDKLNGGGPCIRQQIYFLLFLDLKTELAGHLRFVVL